MEAFNTNGIVYDNSPWRPGRDMDLLSGEVVEDERKMKNLATRIMSNGVEVLVKDKSSDGKPEQRKIKFMHATTLRPSHHHATPALPQKSLLSSAVATVVNHQQISAMFPIHQPMQHNYIIKTCMTTYTYLTTVVHNKRSAISTFETIVSVVTTESLTNVFGTDVLANINPTKTKYMEVKTIQPSASNYFVSNFPKIDKRIDSEEELNFDVIQPSEISHSAICTTKSCSCSNLKTETLQTKYTKINPPVTLPVKYGVKTSKYSATKFDLRPTTKETLDKKPHYTPYEYETSLAPTDRIVEKYTEVINDFSDEKDSASVEESELLTNEQGPEPPKTNKVPQKNPEKFKPEKPHKPNKNKFVVADLLRLGSLSIKGLSQLAPVIEKMTGGFIKRQEYNTTSTTTTTVKPAVKLTAYHVNKRVDSEIDSKYNNFPIYIPVDELETSESQTVFTNATLHRNLAWVAEHKQSKARIVPPKMIHESPLVNGGIPISPGEIITANSDVIVGKPAVGGPLTLAASGIKLHNQVNPPPLDSFIAGNEQSVVKELPPIKKQNLIATKVDDSFDLRPPGLPKPKTKPNRNLSRPPMQMSHYNPQIHSSHNIPQKHNINENMMKTEQIKVTNSILSNHGRPAFLDYIPALGKPNNNIPLTHHIDYKPVNEDSDEEMSDNSPSSSEVVNTRVKVNNAFINSNPDSIHKPFLVDIQPSRVANVLIPHGSTTALVFAGSSEPHKSGDYVDDPLPYPEPGYFGSFSIDAPQMTNVHNVPPNSKLPNLQATESQKQNVYYKDQPFGNDYKSKWKDNKRPIDYSNIPPPTSNQETHFQVGPQITVYNPDTYKGNNGDFDKYNQIKGSETYKDGKEVIDREYENYLAVPPPPPPKNKLNHEYKFDKKKPYNQRPIIHTQPIQDMKVFLNIQHPVPKPYPEENGSGSPKVTSEIYYAAQAPNTKPSPTYTIQMPGHGQSNNLYSHQLSQNVHTSHNQNALPTFSSTFNPVPANEVNDKDNTYTVTLNTATNVASGVRDSAQVIGSSVSVPLGTSHNIDKNQMNTDIPVGTNFAIRVEDTPQFESYDLSTGTNPTIYHGFSPNPVKFSFDDDKWVKNISEIVKDNVHVSTVLHENKEPINKLLDKENTTILQSHNSHANFPIVYDASTPSTHDDNVKPVTEYSEDVKLDTKRPPKLIPNIPTNSHGWYSSILLNEKNNINSMNIDVTTRKIIPLINEYKDQVLNFGQKVTSAGKPPAEFWPQNVPTINTFNVGKPFSKSTETTKPTTNVPPMTTKVYEANYIPNLNFNRQPVYDIPIFDNSDETTTTKKPEKSTQKVKPVYENSEEIYDGEEEENNSQNDGEVSSESMKVPVVTSSVEFKDPTKATTQLNLFKGEEFKPPSYAQKDNNEFVNFNPGTQTEKPFGTNNKTTTYYSNTIKPIYKNNHYNMKPRPFTVNTMATLDHQLHQPHWQINQLMVNSTNMSYEENLDLNIGEEMSTVATNKPISTSKTPHRYSDYVSKYRRPQRPINQHNVTRNTNDSNIITSTVHIKDRKPLIVEVSEKSTLPTFTITTNMDVNRTSSEIIDLSPPPPTIDYNFRPSTNDEMIMGMSPPPPQNPPARRPLPRTPSTSRPNIRNPPQYWTKPPHTSPPRVTTQKPTRKPVNRDEISTYRPVYDINKRPMYAERDQPSAILLPPPRDPPSRIGTPSGIDVLEPSETVSVVPNVVFPTLISSGWLTSSAIEFSSSFGFDPTSVHEAVVPSISKLPDIPSSSEQPHSYEIETSSEKMGEVSSEKSHIESQIPKSNTTTKAPSISSETSLSDTTSKESSQEESSTENTKVVSFSSKHRTRKPYPIRNDDKKSSTNKYKLPTRPTSISIRPTRTLSRPEILYPTRHTSIRKIVRPLPSRSPTVLPSSIIESSESSIEDDFIKPTEVIREDVKPTLVTPMLSSTSSTTEKPYISSSIPTPSLQETSINLIPTHHAGNEVKISDEPLPTKTEFKTTVVTLTKIFSEPPTTVSSIGYVNLTHTLTVTHTKTSLMSKSEGAVTQTLVLTNTQTSTRVDVVTEIYTQVQPTTIIETVTKHIPIPQVEPTPVQEVTANTKVSLDDISMSSEERDNFIIKDSETTENVQKIDTENETDNDTFFVVMNKSQNGGKAPPINNDVDTSEYDLTRNEQVNNNGVSQVLFGEILLAGTPYLETTNVVHPTGFGKECQPDCKASRNERCQRIDGLMKCVCRPGFARMFPDRPCKPTYTYSVKLALKSQGKQRLLFHQNLADNSSKQYHDLAMATYEGINRMVMQSDLRDVFHGVHITGFQPVEMKQDGEPFQGVMNDFYVQLSDNAHESRLKEVIEKYLRNNNYSLGGTDVFASGELMEKLDVSDFDECTSGQFHDCSEHAQCFNLRGTYTCSCLEGFADLSMNTLYPGRICSAEPVGCELCNYHGACYSRDDRRNLCECFQWYAGSTCQVNLKVVLISLVVLGALLTVVLAACAVIACRPRSQPRSIVACIQTMPSLHQGAAPSKQRADRRALISERGESGDNSSIQNASLPYMPAKNRSSGKKCTIAPPPAHEPPPPPPAVVIPRARLHGHDIRDNSSRKKSLEMCSEAKLISYLESGATTVNDEMRRKHSLESSYSANKDRMVNKQGALISAGFKVSTTVRPDELVSREEREDLSSVHKGDLDDLGRFGSLGKSYSTLSEARSVGGTLPASTGRAASSTRLTHQEANTMAERDLGSTFLLPHVHLYKPDLTSDVSEFDSL